MPVSPSTGRGWVKLEHKPAQGNADHQADNDAAPERSIRLSVGIRFQNVVGQDRGFTPWVKVAAMHHSSILRELQPRKWQCAPNARPMRKATIAAIAEKISHAVIVLPIRAAVFRQP